MQLRQTLIRKSLQAHNTEGDACNKQGLELNIFNRIVTHYLTFDTIQGYSHTCYCFLYS